MTLPKLHFSPEKILGFFKNLLPNTIGALKWLRDILLFEGLLMLYVLAALIKWLTNNRFTPEFVRSSLAAPVLRVIDKMVSWGAKSEQTINRYNLIEVALRNMMHKKVRTFITIGGMTIGIGAIVFLVSIGYGLQRLVVSRVARLEEMQQTDVSLQPGSNVVINDRTMADIKNTQGVSEVLPLIAMVGRIEYANSVSDMAVYGVTSQYLEQSAIRPIEGKVFESSISIDELIANQPSITFIDDVPESVTVDASSSASLTATESASTATSSARTASSSGELTSDELVALGLSADEVAALSVASEEDGDGTVDWIKVASGSGVVASTQAQSVSLAADAKQQAVVNIAMLSVLGIPESDAVGTRFDVSFVATSELLSGLEESIESVATEYEIIGVVPGDTTPFLYVPFTDVRGLGIQNYSQLKVVAESQGELSDVRKTIEAMGFSTSSVVDTVAQIDRLFATIRTILGVLGLVALAVAALGMFNTLTVSLLERTREVGLMKAMGMKSYEVRELFLTESMIMGMFGGIGGVVLGIIAGKLVGVVITIFGLGKGVGFIDVSYVPLIFMTVVLVLSIFVGIVTGIFPARRATKISALDALRYE